MGFVVILTGFIGRALAVKLLSLGELEVGDGEIMAIDRLILLDAVDVELPSNAITKEGKVDERVVCKTGVDLRSERFEQILTELVTDDDHLSTFHLGGIASGDGERDDAGADLALDVNFDGTRKLMTCLRDRDRRCNKRSRLVFTSTNAVFAPTETITDDSTVMPRTSYGSAKAMCELLINDWSRRRFLDGRCTRMPAVIPRTTPNASLASAWSEIIAEPCAGRTAKLCVDPSTSLPVISIFRMMDNIIRLHNVSDATLGENRVVTMPAKPVTLEAAEAAVRDVLLSRGMELPDVIAQTSIDPKVADVVKTWPPNHHVTRAFQLGWTVDKSVTDVINEFLDKRHLLP